MHPIAEKSLRDIDYHKLWTIKGPRMTAVQRVTCIEAKGPSRTSLFLVMDYGEDGWEIFQPVTTENSIPATIDAVKRTLARTD